MTAGEHLLYLHKCWKKCVSFLWDYKCAFPGCIHKPQTIHLTMKSCHRFNPFNGICTCVYHKKIIKILAKLLIEAKFSHLIEFSKAKPVVKTEHIRSSLYQDTRYTEIINSLLRRNIDEQIS